MAGRRLSAERITDAICACTHAVNEYLPVKAPDVNLSHRAKLRAGAMTVAVFDPVADHLELTRTMFDFAALGRMFVGGSLLAFDAMRAVTGPYARAIFRSSSV